MRVGDVMQARCVQARGIQVGLRQAQASLRSSASELGLLCRIQRGKRRVMRPPRACHGAGDQGNPLLGRRQHSGAAVHRVMRAAQQAAGGQAAHDALDGGRVHGGEPAEQVLGDPAELHGLEQGGELGRGQAVLAGDLQEQRDVPLVRPAEQKSDMILDQEPATGGTLAIG